MHAYITWSLRVHLECTGLERYIFISVTYIFIFSLGGSHHMPLWSCVFADVPYWGRVSAWLWRLSFKHFPNINIYDFARGIATHTHTNLRKPECVPFRPYEGRLKEPTPENIKLAVEGKLKVNLLWLKEKKDNVDPDCYPVTGSAEHYALYNLFQEKNTKDARDELCKIQTVPELADWVNGQCAEQLFSDTRKNNYLLNTLSLHLDTFSWCEKYYSIITQNEIRR